MMWTWRFASLLVAAAAVQPVICAMVREKNPFDATFEPSLGQLGTVKYIEEQVNTVGGNMNAFIDYIHDTDHGVRICNVDQGPENHGVCYMGFKCEWLHGTAVGSCLAPTPKTTCCKFERFCGEESTETVTYFKVDPRLPPSSEDCVFTVKSRLGSCQARIDFIELELPPQDAKGRCGPAHLEIVNPTLGVFHTLCGSNSGNHLYVPISTRYEHINFYVKNPNAEKPFSWNIRVTQIDCRSGVKEMRALRAPDGCLQYFTAPTGAIASFNFDGTNPIARGYDYAICFRQDIGVCELAFKSDTFALVSGSDNAANADSTCNVPNTYLMLAASLDRNGDSLRRDRFCGYGSGGLSSSAPSSSALSSSGPGFGDSAGFVATRAKPFVLRVRTDDKLPPRHDSTGFLLVYSLAQDKDCLQV